jgi:hypothetical protein
MSKCHLCLKHMLKKRFPTKFLMKVNGKHYTENFFTCRDCRRIIDTTHILPHQVSQIRVLRMEEPDGIGIPKNILKPLNNKRRTKKYTKPVKKPPTKETLFHIHDSPLSSKETTPTTSQTNTPILSPKSHHIAPRCTLLSLMSGGRAY